MLLRQGGVLGGGHRLVVKEGIVVGHPRLRTASFASGPGPDAVRNRAEWTLCVQEPAKCLDSSQLPLENTTQNAIC